jgi:hypothetical protein
MLKTSNNLKVCDDTENLAFAYRKRGLQSKRPKLCQPDTEFAVTRNVTTPSRGRTRELVDAQAQLVNVFLAYFR